MSTTLTPWFSHTVLPVREGWYKTRFAFHPPSLGWPPGRWSWLRYWNGQRWSISIKQELFDIDPHLANWTKTQTSDIDQYVQWAGILK